jgi:hypothetical protein
MSVDGFIEMPSFRPDGRLERLNHGGGSKLPKTIPGEPKRFQNQPDLIRLMALSAYQSNHGNKTKELDLKAGYQGGPYGVKGPVSPGQKTSSGKGKVVAVQGKGPVSGTGTSDAGAVYSERPPAAASAGVAPKKRRTLLSGGGRSFNQPYGYDTVLGA